jgi:hypothetical protein
MVFHMMHFSYCLTGICKKYFRFVFALAVATSSFVVFGRLCGEADRRLSFKGTWLPSVKWYCGYEWNMPYVEAIMAYFIIHSVYAPIETVRRQCISSRILMKN